MYGIQASNIHEHQTNEKFSDVEKSISFRTLNNNVAYNPCVSKTCGFSFVIYCAHYMAVCSIKPLYYFISIPFKSHDKKE